MSKSLGYLVKIGDVSPSAKAIKISKKVGEDPRFIELLLRESDKVLFVIPFKKFVDLGIIKPHYLSTNTEEFLKAVSTYPAIFITLRDGQLWSDSGIDSSNHPEGIYSIPPRDLDGVARDIAIKLRELTGKYVAVIISDTELMPFGSLDIARGSYGIEVITRGFGGLDRYGKPKFGGVDNVVHEACCAAALLMRQCSEGIPVVIIRGLLYERSSEGVAGHSLTVGVLRRRVLIEVLKETVRVLGLRHLISLLIP